jgi:tetratricopeptide (TPR) repeat protein
VSVGILAKFDQEILDLVKAEKFDQALWIAEESYEFARNKFGEIHLETAKSLNNLAWLYDLNQRYDIAEVFYLRAIGLKKAICGKGSVDLVVSMENLSSLYLSRGKYRKAQELLEGLIEIVQSQPEPWLFRKAVYLSQLADIKKYQGDVSTAESLYHKCAAFIESTMPLDHPNLGRIFANIADFYMAIDKHTRAQIYYHRAYTILIKKTSKKHPDIQYIVGQMNKIRSMQPLPESNRGKRR